MEFLFTEVNILHCTVSSLAIERKSKSRKLSSTPGKKASKVGFRYQLKSEELFFIRSSPLSLTAKESKQKKKVNLGADTKLKLISKIIFIFSLAGSKSNKMGLKNH